MRRIGLVGCVKKKADGAKPAQELYCSQLFLARRRYVERTCDEWWILSALHGLLGPQEFVAPYDVTLAAQPVAGRRAWSADVLRDFERKVAASAGDAVEFHAGNDYREFGLADGLRALGLAVVNPTRGMRLGQQLQFYSQVEVRQ